MPIRPPLQLKAGPSAPARPAAGPQPTNTSLPPRQGALSPGLRIEHRMGQAGPAASFWEVSPTESWEKWCVALSQKTGVG